jgi:hypothetical protein
MKKDLPSHSRHLPISVKNTGVSLRSSSREYVHGHPISYTSHPHRYRKRRIPNLDDDGEDKGKGKEKHKEAIPVQVAAANG